MSFSSLIKSTFTLSENSLRSLKNKLEEQRKTLRLTCYSFMFLSTFPMCLKRNVPHYFSRPLVSLSMQ